MAENDSANKVKSGSDSSIRVKVAIIGGIFLVVAAICAGFFQIINTLVEQGIIIGPIVQVGNPNEPTQTPNALTIELSTPALRSIGTLIVPANSNEGIKFTAPESGQYIFKYSAGAYSTYPLESIPGGTPTWLTAVRIFKNRPVEWNGDAISNSPDISAVDFGYSSSSSEAEAKVQGQEAVVSLMQGDYLILVGVDGRPYYSDNPGEVIFEVLFTPTQ